MPWIEESVRITHGKEPVEYALLLFGVSLLTIYLAIGVILAPIFGLYLLYQIIHQNCHWIQVTSSKIHIHYLIFTVTIPKDEFLRASLSDVADVGSKDLSVLTLHTVSGDYRFGLVDNPKYAEEILWKFKNGLVFSEPEQRHRESHYSQQSSSSPGTSPHQKAPDKTSQSYQKAPDKASPPPQNQPTAAEKTQENQSAPAEKEQRREVVSESERLGIKLEKSVFFSLAASDDIPGHHKELRDVYIPKDDGGYAQIDVLMIHENGIYVFECKNYKGWIFGSENNQYWYQTLNAGYGQSRKEQFYNPIRQNKSHINALSKYLGTQKEYFDSGIVFGREAVLKAVPEDSSHCFIAKYQRFEGKLIHRIRTSPVYISHSEVDRIYSVLYPCANVPESVKEKHKQNIKARYG